MNCIVNNELFIISRLIVNINRKKNELRNYQVFNKKKSIGKTITKNTNYNLLTNACNNLFALPKMYNQFFTFLNNIINNFDMDVDGVGGMIVDNCTPRIVITHLLSRIQNVIISQIFIVE